MPRLDVRPTQPFFAVASMLLVLACGSETPTPATRSTPAPQRAVGAPFVRVIGTVQDGGFPHAGCDHAACTDARETDRPRYVASIAIVLPASQKVFLIDATPDLRPQLDLLADVRQAPTDRVDRSPVDGVFLTHAHIGHYLGLAFFGFEAIHTRDLPVWCTPRMAGYLRSNGPWSQLVELENLTLNELGPDEAVDLGEGVSVTAIRSPHRDEYADTVGFAIRGPSTDLFYLPDTDSWLAWDTPIDEFLAGFDVALIDATFFSGEELPGRPVASIGHPLIVDSIERLGALAAAGETRIVFTHLNHSNPALVPGSEANATIRQAGFAVAREGDEIEL